MANSTNDPKSRYAGLPTAQKALPDGRTIVYLARRFLPPGSSSLVVYEHTLRDAMVRGLPLGELGIDAGDEVVLRAAPQRNWMLVAQLAGLVTGIVVSLKALKIF